MVKWSLSLFLLLSVSCSQVQEQSGGKWRIDFTATLKEIDKKFYFVVDGATNLPDGAQLTAVMAYIYFLKRGAGEDFVANEGYLTDKTLEVQDGKFYATLGGYKRRPFSIGYRCIVKFDPQNQFENVKGIVGNVEAMEKAVDMRLGSAAEFESELLAVKTELKEDFAKLDMLFKQLKDVSHSVDKDAFEELVSEIEQRNERRIGNWLMSLETQGKIYIGGLCDRLRELVIVRGDAKKFDDLAAAFTEIYNEEIYIIGFDTPIDEEKAAACLKKLNEALANSSEGVFSAAIFELSTILPERYLKRLTDISERFQNADLQGVKSALTELEKEISNRR